MRSRSILTLFTLALILPTCSACFRVSDQDATEQRIAKLLDEIDELQNEQSFVRNVLYEKQMLEKLGGKEPAAGSMDAEALAIYRLFIKDKQNKKYVIPPDCDECRKRLEKLGLEIHDKQNAIEYMRERRRTIKN